MTPMWMVAIVWLHFLADFVFQTDWMALNKSSRHEALALHVLVYSLFLLPFGWRYALLNAAAHFATDWCSSRVTKRLWERGQRHAFFVVVGFDQALHLTALVSLWRFSSCSS